MALAACAGGGADVVGLSPIQDVTIRGESQVALDGTTRLVATLRGANGETVEGRPVFWSSSDAQVATVDQSGLVTPVAVGSVRIAASAEGKSGVLDVQIVRKRARSVDVVVAGELAVGDTVAARATVTGSDGVALPGVAPSFSSTAPEVASVTADGRVIGRGTGTAGIVAIADGIADTAIVTVVLARVGSVLVDPASFELIVGQTLPLRVTIRDRNGAPLAARGAAYASSNAAVASVDADGIVRALSPGAATITASSGGASATSLVTVVAPPSAPPAPPAPPSAPVPATLAVSPAAVSLQVGATQALSATLRDNRGDLVTGRSVTWHSSAPSIASVSGSGIVTAVAPGAAVITAEAAGITGSAGVTVTAIPVDRVDVTPGTASLEVGNTVQLTATPRSADGAALAGRTVTWGTSSAAVATVSSTGEVRAIGPGTATIVATSEGRQGSATITVTAAPAPPVAPGSPARIEKVSGDRQRADAGSMLRDPLVARVVDATGRPVAGVSVLWATSDGGRFTPAIDVTDANGLVSTRWRLGNREGEQRAQIFVLGLEAVTFTAVAEDD